MLDIMDYITLRKDITFAERGFQEIDALIFSELAYVDWQHRGRRDPASRCL